jgi:hypothetical protein
MAMLHIRPTLLWWQTKKHFRVSAKNTSWQTLFSYQFIRNLFYQLSKHLLLIAVISDLLF